MELREIQTNVGIEIISLREKHGLSHKDFLEVLQTLIDTFPKD